MAASIETQRLIYVSLGKIAQSRGQRGGINLHKNLLVATVLHKARTQHMMETYNFQQQQQQTLQRQKLQQEELLQQQQQQAIEQRNLENQSSSPSETVCSSNDSPAARDQQVCQASCVADLGQSSLPSAASAGSEDMGSTVVSSPSVVPCEESPQEVEAMSVQESEPCVVDKENNPPPSAEMTQTQSIITDSSVSDNVPVPQNEPVSGSDHIIAATKLSQEAQLVIPDLSPCGLQNQNSTTSGSPTCQGILKRRRVNTNNTSSDLECPASKRARVTSSDSLSSYSSPSRSSSPISSILASLPSEISDYSSDDSESESEPELSAVMHQSQDNSSSQISNLVNIFNSGFSGLCANPTDCSSNQDSGYQSDFDISPSQPQYTTLTNKLRSESPSLCSTEVGRLDSLQSAIILSA